MRHVGLSWAVGFAALVAGCGGGSSSGTSSATTYSVGGTVSGLTGTIVLEDNGGDTLSLSNNGSFAFATTLTPGTAYNVTIGTQPTDQTCTVTDASGTLQESVTNIAVSCVSNSAVAEQWMWLSGADSVDAPGSYGTQGAAAASNTPGARRASSAWTDASGNLWLFGGYGTAGVAGTVGMLNDLWEYNFSAGGSGGPAAWIWQGGANAVGAAASYGTLNAAAASNSPGGREGAASWTDTAGNLWLFGGDSLSSQGSEQFNDVWEFDTTSLQWTWVAGSDTANGAGSYGALGTAASGNLPPARTNAITWVDGSGVFWLFGGEQLNANGTLAAVFNDLWSFNPQTLIWTWVGGSSTPNAQGVYGVQGTAAAGNVPGARTGGNAWVDASGNFWIFGGQGLSVSSVSQQYNDLWEYSPVSHQWTWVAGSDTPNANGVYSTEGSGVAGDSPGSRLSAVAWKDSAGNFWLFGGYGSDAQSDVNALSDLWEYTLSTGVWTWVGGSAVISASGVYGVEGTSAAVNMPGARQGATGWVDTSGNLYLFGGYGLDAFGDQQNLNDLWSYTPNP